MMIMTTYGDFKDTFYYDPKVPTDQFLKNLFQNNAGNMLSTDFVAYRIYLVDPQLECSFNEDEETCEEVNEQLLQSTALEIHQFLMENIPQNYIWQGDAFHLNIVSPKQQIDQLEPEILSMYRNNQPIYPLLFGRIDFTETNIDEWFVTYLLMELSRKFQNRVVIQIQDQDGEFLLIEAAMHIEEWMNEDPQLTQNRVFIFNGQVHILPDQPQTPSHAYYEVFPVQTPIHNIHKAVEMVTREHKFSLANKGVQHSIKARLSSFPKEAHDYGTQRIACYLPLDIIKILDKHPQSISKAIYYWIHRNSVTEKFLNTCSRFFPSPRSVNSHTNIASQNSSSVVTFTPRDYFTYVTVHVNRCQYVQLLASRIETIPPILQPIYKPNAKRTEEQEQAYMFGLKILCGFEIYYQTERPLDLLESFEDYLEHLDDHGYFGMELPGTETYNTLIQKQKIITKWIRFHNMLKMKELKQRKLKVDPDDWLDSAQEEMEKYLTQKGMTEEFEDEEILKQKAMDLMNGVKSFVEEQGTGFEGIEFNYSQEKGNDSREESATESSSSSSRLDKLLQDTFGKLKIEDLIDKYDKKDEEYLKKFSKELYCGEALDEDDEENEEWEDIEDNTTVDPEMQNIMKEMDEELLQYSDTQQRSGMTSDVNVMKNLLKSMKAQGGDIGPASILLEHLGLKMPIDFDEEDEEEESDDT
ncbi:hypothetical protein C9374_011747 [Naegleria lovaniensis]|uniref:Uncharacterized protein n=1 Tax=Naegleria lovaniensis TaxID=51637 RepID=A0AA88G9M5_NAELO|nr:uncharacterized protein C9374_011747 [Naegleria lovaniensis]KAG2373862.1 hypothetical protein C9374_011747 [Naegleria lovaniensis]